MSAAKVHGVVESGDWTYCGLALFVPERRRATSDDWDKVTCQACRRCGNRGAPKRWGRE
jgi:hypothetical protein